MIFFNWHSLFLFQGNNSDRMTSSNAQVYASSVETETDCVLHFCFPLKESLTRRARKAIGRAMEKLTTQKHSYARIFQAMKFSASSWLCLFVAKLLFGAEVLSCNVTLWNRNSWGRVLYDSCTVKNSAMAETFVINLSLNNDLTSSPSQMNES